MNINFGLRHLLLWQTYHFCNWISAVPLEKPTIPSNSLENSSETKGDLFTDKHIEKPATINGNYSAVVTITTLKTFSLPIQANDAKQTPKLSNELSTTEWPANHSNIDFKDNGNKSAFLKNQHGTSKEHNLRLSNKSPEDKFVERMVRDKRSTTEVYNELDLFQTNKSENATLILTDNSTMENNTMIYGNETNHNLSSSIEATNSANITEHKNFTTPEMTYLQTTNANTQPATKDDVITVSTTSSPQTQEQTTHEYRLFHHFTGFAQNVPVRSQYPHHNHHHLNLVPMEDSPFGNLLWKDKKYLISILVPISIGIVGAGCIIGMAYMARFCYRNERQIQIMKERVTQPQETNTDNIVLLDDSDDEF